MNEISAPDTSLLQWQEGELCEAETKVLKAFREGWKTGEGLVTSKGLVQVVVPPEGSSTPEKPAEGHTADNWQDAILRAGFLRDLFLGNYGKFDPRPIVISRAWIEGRLDLDYCESRLPLLFSHCVFSDGISLQRAVIPELQLPGCEAHHLSSSRTRRSLFAPGVKVSANVFLVDGFKAGGEVNLVGAEIGGVFQCRGYFEKGLNAESLKASSGVFMNSVRGDDGQVLAFESNGEVNLAGAEIGGQFICRGGHFKKGMNATNLKTSSDVFMNSVQGDDGQVLAFESNGEVNLFGAEIGGQFYCRGHFEKGLNATNLKTSSDVFMNSDQGDDGQMLAFESNGKVNLIGAKIGGDFYCRGHFKEGLNATNLKTSSDVFMNSVQGDDGQVLAFESNGEVILASAEIGGQFYCSGGHFEKGLNATNLKTSSDVFMDSDQGADGQVLAFKSNGEVKLASAEIGGQFYCSGGHFEKGLNATNLKTSRDVFMDSDQGADGQVLAFKSNGEVKLASAEIGGQFYCSGGHFEKGLNATNLKTSRDVFMDSVQGGDGQVLAFKSNGEVNLFGAEIGGQFSCRGGHFEKGLNAINLKTSSDVFMDSVRGDDGQVIRDAGGQVLAFESNGEVILRNAEIGGSLDLGGAKVEDTPLHNLQIYADMNEVRENLNFIEEHRDLIFLDNTEVRGALGNLQKWPRIGSANGFRYQAIESGDGWKAGLNWVSRMSEPSKEFSPQPYEQLMSVYRSMGHTNWARNIGFALEKRRSKEFKGWQWFTWRPWYGILKWTIGYGYKPFRFVPWALGLMMAGFLLFSSGHSWQAPAFLDNEWIPSDSEALESESWKKDGEPPPDYLPFNPLIYSLEATFPVLNLGQLGKWHPSNPFLLGVRWVWTLIGTLLLAILALFGAGVLGPRWRSGDEGG